MEIEERIRDFLAKSILFTEEGFPYSDEVSLLDNGIVDSLGVMELVTLVQTEFGVNVNPLEVTPENFDSVARLAAYIRTKTAAVAAVRAPEVRHASASLS